MDFKTIRNLIQMQFIAMDCLSSSSKLFGPCLYLGISFLILLRSDVDCLAMDPVIDGAGSVALTRLLGFIPNQPLKKYIFFIIFWLGGPFGLLPITQVIFRRDIVFKSLISCRTRLNLFFFHFSLSCINITKSILLCSTYLEFSLST